MKISLQQQNPEILINHTQKLAGNAERTGGCFILPDISMPKKYMLKNGYFPKNRMQFLYVLSCVISAKDCARMIW